MISRCERAAHELRFLDQNPPKDDTESWQTN
jgi:hypothetical protein